MSVGAEAGAATGASVVIVSSIWPPDVGGPASHGPELGAFLEARGHRVRAVSSCGPAGPDSPGFPVRGTRRDRPLAVRLPASLATIARAAGAADVVYTTGMYTRSAMAAGLRRRPLVVKLVGDPAYERARARGLFSGTLEEFQECGDGGATAMLKRIRRAAAARADRVIIPSEYLARIVRGWGIESDRIVVIPNPAPEIERPIDRELVRARLGVEGMTFVFAGRLARAKNVPLAVRALRSVPGASLVILGDGPEQAAVERAAEDAGVRDRVVMKGALRRSEVVEWLIAADVALLPSDWENFPHAAVEALAAGTAVIATAVGGVPEIIRDGREGILVRRGDEEAFAGAMRSLASDRQRLSSLRRAAKQAARSRYSAAALFADIETELLVARATARRNGGSCGGGYASTRSTRSRSAAAHRSDVHW